jgi:hypothetical protein
MTTSPDRCPSARASPQFIERLLLERSRLGDLDRFLRHQRRGSFA